jgi:hypothetical protein
MNVWAQSCAYEQRLGKWRETKGGKKISMGDPGAKSVLAAVAAFADVYVHLGEASKKRAMERFGRNYRLPKSPSEDSETTVNNSVV